MDKIKNWESGEEFVFDGIKKVPVFGAVYAVPRTLTYGLMGNKSQSISSAKGFVDNVKGTTGLAATLAITPVRLAANAGGALISRWGSKEGDASKKLPSTSTSASSGGKSDQTHQ